MALVLVVIHLVLVGIPLVFISIHLVLVIALQPESFDQKSIL